MNKSPVFVCVCRLGFYYIIYAVYSIMIHGSLPGDDCDTFDDGDICVDMIVMTGKRPNPGWIWQGGLGSRTMRRQSGTGDARMMTSSNGNIFRVPGHLCGEFTGIR